MWAAIWDRAGLQNRPARFNSSAACEHSLRRGTRSGPARVSGGEPSPGPARSLVEVAKTVRPPTATRCTRGFDSRPRLSCKCTRGRSERGTGLPSRRSGFYSRRVLGLFFCREGWHPSRPHKPDPVGSIPTPATSKRDLPPLTVGQSHSGRHRPHEPGGDRMDGRHEPWLAEGRIPRWQTAGRTSASRRSSGEMTAERCLSSVDGDVPGPYPGEDRSSRSRGSDTRVAKRQRRRLLSAPPQVRILPLVQIA